MSLKRRPQYILPENTFYSLILSWGHGESIIMVNQYQGIAKKGGTRGKNAVQADNDRCHGNDDAGAGRARCVLGF
jgi:hypothetical protein